MVQSFLENNLDDGLRSIYAWFLDHQSDLRE